MKAVLIAILALLLFTVALCAKASNPVANRREMERKPFAHQISGRGLQAEHFQLQSLRRRAGRKKSRTPVTNGLSFQTLMRAAPPGTEPDAPTVYVATNAGDLQSFARFLSPEHKQRVADGVDFSSQAVLAVFAGAKGSSGYEILIERIKVVDGQMQIVVKLTQPAPQDYALQVLTSPFHIVRVRKESLKGVDTSSWILMDAKGARLAASRSN